LFANQNKLATTTGLDLNTQLNVLAQSLGLNTGSFANCLSSQKYLDQIRRDFNDGETLQIQGTPTWFINNYPITGNIPADKFPTLIQGLVK
jgi:protein-disulfide isomerase